ncbi:hypothetical protein ACIP98_13770 [Streptomyces sp. NPDC088354]|uniref:hypothetical protein n=1 Tax=unclassified Streptomyces TaxID=2593676 RepID=UPI0029A7452E|nr:hypothetical protein [Streptomyces sp. MI02-7b]MDX3071081.1 hypothetical protein [Streptomyces sp. MI02-7b]
MAHPISDDDMRAAMAAAKEYTAVVLEAGPAYGTAEAGPVIREHGRRNFALRAEGVLPIVCPVTDDGEVRGIGILDTDPDTARALMAEDPGVKAGVFTFTLHPVRSFPGDRLR